MAILLLDHVLGDAPPKPAGAHVEEAFGQSEHRQQQDRKAEQEEEDVDGHQDQRPQALTIVVAWITASPISASAAPRRADEGPGGLADGARRQAGDERHDQNA